MSSHADTIRAGILAVDGARDGDVVLEALRALVALEAELVTQADRIAWLEGDVAGWRIKNQQLRDALDRGRRFERCYQESLGAVWTGPMQERLDSLQSAFLDAYSDAALDGTPSEDA